MKLLRMRTLGMFGIGFLAGSAAGKGPWEKAQAGMDMLKGKVSGMGGPELGSTTSSNGFQATQGGMKPQVTEI
ncbi:MAG TPA: hypothetical protein VHL53_12475 [Acidimicrobiia bacterium]|nr:hypothetical protein [Acidimicrobiia bacterium]